MDKSKAAGPYDSGRREAPGDRHGVVPRCSPLRACLGCGESPFPPPLLDACETPVGWKFRLRFWQRSFIFAGGARAAFLLLCAGGLPAMPRANPAAYSSSACTQLRWQWPGLFCNCADNGLGRWQSNARRACTSGLDAFRLPCRSAWSCAPKATKGLDRSSVEEYVQGESFSQVVLLFIHGREAR